jgi:hypothetical protein
VFGFSSSVDQSDVEISDQDSDFEAAVPTYRQRYTNLSSDDFPDDPDF